MSDDNENSEPTSPFELSIDRRVSSLEHSRKFWKWAAPALVTIGITLCGYLGSMVATSAERSGRDGALIDGLRKSIDVLDLDVRELRSKILKLSGVDPDSSAVVIAVTP